MTDSTLPTSAGRLASFLDRQFCVWMPSPSVALLAAFVTGKGRPKRLLSTEGAPAFISNLGRITGATAVTVSQENIDETLKGLLRTEGLSAENIWAVATHRGGKLSPTDWLSRCDARGIPTVELCLGSLRALARWTPFPATFTIVDLDAEEAFAGVRLAALLTNDRKGAARVQELCLPVSGAKDYILDALPRGLVNDETALARLIDEVIAREGEMPQGARRFDSAGNSVSIELLSRLEEQQRVIDGWEARFTESEAEAAQDAALLSRARADLLKEKAESASALASWRAEKESLAQKLLRAERERDLTVADAARRDESERGLQRELRQREEEFEKTAASSAEREARLTGAAEASRAQLSARIARLEADAAANAGAGADLLLKKEEAERSLASMQAERDSLTRKLSDLEAELGEALAETARREAEHRAALDAPRQSASKLQAETAALAARLAKVEKDRDLALSEAARREEAERALTAEQGRRAERLEGEIAALKGRDTRLTAEWATVRSGLSEQIARLEAEAVRAEKAFDEVRKEMATELSDALRTQEALRAETEKLGLQLAAMESEHARVLAEAGKRGQEEQVQAREAERARVAEASARELAEVQKGLEEQRRRAAQLEEEGAILKKRETQLTDEWALARAEMSERIAGLESAAAASETERAALLAQKAEGDRAVPSMQAEGEALRSKIAEMEKGHAIALAEMARGQEAQRLAVEAEKRRVEKLETAVAAHAEREGKLNREWEASRTELAERLRRAEDAAVVARNANIGLQNRKNEAEQARVSLQSELEEQMRLAQQFKMEAATVAAREAKKVEAAEASRAELEARLAKREAAEVIADKARTELLNRKRESDQALAAVQADRAALLRKIAALEGERDDIRSAVASLTGDHPVEQAAPARSPAGPLPSVGTSTNTGGLSALVNLWNTAVIKRPARIKEKEGKPPEPDILEVFEVDSISNEAKAPTSPPPSPVAETREKPEPAPEIAAAAKKPDRPAPVKPPEKAKEHRTTGGLSALVNLWTTAATMRPFRRKENAAKSSEPAVESAPGIELTADEAKPPVERPEKTARPRPTPTRRPDPKPAPAPDETEKLGGWLRGLAGRMRGKPK